MALEERVKPRMFRRVAACGGEIRGLRLLMLVERRAERVDRVLGGAALGDQRGGCLWVLALRRPRLAAQTQPLDQALIAIEVVRREVPQQTPTVADDLQQTPARVMVLLVGLEVLRELTEPLGQKRNLNLGGPSVPVLQLLLLDDPLLRFGRYQLDFL